MHDVVDGTKVQRGESVRRLKETRTVSRVKARFEEDF